MATSSKIARSLPSQGASSGTALTVSKVMPYAVGALLAGWMVLYGRRARREGERLAAAAQAAAEFPPPAAEFPPPAAEFPPAVAAELPVPAGAPLT